MTTQEKAPGDQSEATKHPFKSATLIVAVCSFFAQVKQRIDAAPGWSNPLWLCLMIFSTGVQIGLLLALLERWTQ